MCNKNQVSSESGTATSLKDWDGTTTDRPQKAHENSGTPRSIDIRITDARDVYSPEPVIFSVFSINSNLGSVT